MKVLKLFIIAIFGIGLLFSITFKNKVQSQEVNSVPNGQRFAPLGEPDNEESPNDPTERAPSQAPTGFDNLTNGFDPQGPPFETINADNVVANRSFNDNRFIFEQVEVIADGLGPTYNAQSCRECHQNVVTGGASQITEFRSGRLENGMFFESLGGSLIQSRATHPDIVEQTGPQDSIRTFRLSTNTLGNGFVEAISNKTLIDISINQPASVRGVPVKVPVLEAGNRTRIGRFGWKSQHASLESFSGDAYLNEMGITNPLLPEENTSNGLFVGFGTQFDPVPELEDDGEDLEAFANFMRSTKAPSRKLFTTVAVGKGEELFKQIGCATCHVASITTAPAGTRINGGTLIVPAALGNKIIHPYSDFLLHDIGTGDGIPVLPTPDYAFTANMMRTAPLWSLRTRNRLMHDGLSFTLEDAINRHQGQATAASNAFNFLGRDQKDRILAFLNSL